jgi:hypothetical protein
MLKIGMPPNIRLLCIEVLVHIYIGVPPRNPKEGLAVRPPRVAAVKETLTLGALSGKNPNRPGQASRRM